MTGDGYVSCCPQCFPDSPAARVRATCRKHSQPPMERDFPVICRWTRHSAVNLNDLRDELRRALDLLS